MLLLGSKQYNFKIVTYDAMVCSKIPSFMVHGETSLFSTVPLVWPALIFYEPNTKFKLNLYS
jgi:hypothetical protein